MAILLYNKKRDDDVFQNVEAAVLSQTELTQVETLLNACVDEYNQSQKVALQKLQKAQPKEAFETDDFVINLPKYKRQIIAVVNAKGEKEVWLNLFCEAGKTDWHHEIVFVFDGGNCFFNVKLNLSRKSWYDLMVNGSA